MVCSEIMVFFQHRIPPPPAILIMYGRALKHVPVQVDTAEWPALPRKVGIWELCLAARLARVELAPQMHRKWDAALFLQRAVRRWRFRRQPAAARGRKPAVLPVWPINLSSLRRGTSAIVVSTSSAASGCSSRCNKQQHRMRPASACVPARPFHRQRRNVAPMQEQRSANPMVMHRVAPVDREYYRAQKQAAKDRLASLAEMGRRRSEAASNRNSSWGRRRRRSERRCTVKPNPIQTT